MSEERERHGTSNVDNALGKQPEVLVLASMTNLTHCDSRPLFLLFPKWEIYLFDGSQRRAARRGACSRSRSQLNGPLLDLREARTLASY